MKRLMILLFCLACPKLFALPLTLGGNRPAKLYMDKASETPRKLILFLHGYRSQGSHMLLLFDAEKAAARVGGVALIPDGEPDVQGINFWNATPECCNFHGSERDDVAYLSSLIEAAKARTAISDVYIVGHSNGGFMAHRMACERPDLIKGIVSIAGAFFRNPQLCLNPGQVNILQVHGTADNLIPYGPNAQFLDAKGTVDAWRTIYDCKVEESQKAAFHFLPSFGAGSRETDRLEYGGCSGGQKVALWTVNGGAHAMFLRSADFMTEALQLLDR